MNVVPFPNEEVKIAAGDYGDGERIAYELGCARGRLNGYLDGCASKKREMFALGMAAGAFLVPVLGFAWHWISNQF